MAYQKLAVLPVLVTIVAVTSSSSSSSSSRSSSSGCIVGNISCMTGYIAKTVAEIEKPTSVSC